VRTCPKTEVYTLECYWKKPLKGTRI